jgi:hypothetical protein
VEEVCLGAIGAKAVAVAMVRARIKVFICYSKKEKY